MCGAGILLIGADKFEFARGLSVNCFTDLFSFKFRGRVG